MSVTRTGGTYKIKRSKVTFRVEFKGNSGSLDSAPAVAVPLPEMADATLRAPAIKGSLLAHRADASSTVTGITIALWVRWVSPVVTMKAHLELPTAEHDRVFTRVVPATHNVSFVAGAEITSVV